MYKEMYEDIDDLLGEDVKHLNLKEKITDRISFGGRSHCPNCNSKIPIWYNIPILGYFIIAGKARCCGKKVSIRYPLIESITAVGSTLLAFYFPTEIFLFSLAALWFCIPLFLIDLDEKILPDTMVYPLAWLGILFAYLGYSPITLEEATMGYLCGFAVLWVLAFMYKQITGQDGLGGGDPKLLAAICCWTGALVLPYIFLISVVITLLIFILKREREIPYGPGLIAGGILVWNYMNLPMVL